MKFMVLKDDIPVDLNKLYKSYCKFINTQESEKNRKNWLHLIHVVGEINVCENYEKYVENGKFKEMSLKGDEFAELLFSIIGNSAKLSDFWQMPEHQNLIILFKI